MLTQGGQSFECGEMVVKVMYLFCVVLLVGMELLVIIRQQLVGGTQEDVGCLSCSALAIKTNTMMVIVTKARM